MLKKAKTSAIAKSLKAIALERLGRAREAMAIVTALLEEDRIDEETVMTLGVCCKEMGEFEALASMLERVYKRNPAHEENASQFFMGLVRCEK